MEESQIWMLSSSSASRPQEDVTEIWADPMKSALCGYWEEQQARDKARSNQAEVASVRPMVRHLLLPPSSGLSSALCFRTKGAEHGTQSTLTHSINMRRRCSFSAETKLVPEGTLISLSVSFLGLFSRPV